MNLVIRKNPFVTMVVSAVEVYPKECLGVLFGRKAQHAFTVEHAFPYQSAKRTTTMVEVDDDLEKCVDNMLQELTSLKLIGDFHSHTDTRIGTKLTSIDKDKENFKVDEIKVVIAISKKKRRAHWKNHGKKLSGVFDFRFDIVAYMCYNSERQIRKFQKIDIDCPFTLKTWFPKGCRPL